MNGSIGIPGSSAITIMTPPDMPSALGELRQQRLVRGAGDAGLGDEQASGRRHDQRRHLGDQAVADSEQR